MHAGDYVVVNFESQRIQAAEVCRVTASAVEVETQSHPHEIAWVKPSQCRAYSRATLEELGLIHA